MLSFKLSRGKGRRPLLFDLLEYKYVNKRNEVFLIGWSNAKVCETRQTRCC